MPIIVRILFISLLTLCACREQIVHDLGENEANRLLTKLDQVEVKAEKEKQADGRWAIAVDEKDVVRAINHLNDTRLLRDLPDNLNEQSSIISSREDQKFRYERALSREIETTLASLEGVLEARVHLNMPPTDPLFGNPINSAKGSASVLLVTARDFQSSSQDVAGLVAGASGIEAAAIQVVLNKSIATPTEVAKPDNKTTVVKPKTEVGLFETNWQNTNVQVAISLLILGVAAVFIGLRKFKSRSLKALSGAAKSMASV